MGLDSPTYLVYHEEGNEILEGFNDQLPELEGHEGSNGSKIFLNVSRGVVVALGSKADPVFLLGGKKLGTGGDPPTGIGEQQVSGFRSSLGLEDF